MSAPRHHRLAALMEELAHGLELTDKKVFCGRICSTCLGSFLDIPGFVETDMHKRAGKETDKLFLPVSKQLHRLGVSRFEFSPREENRRGRNISQGETDRADDRTVQGMESHLYVFPCHRQQYREPPSERSALAHSAGGYPASSMLVSL